MNHHCCRCHTAESLMDGYRHGMGRAAIVIDDAATQMRDAGADLIPAAATLTAIADSLRRTSASARVVSVVVAGDDTGVEL